MLTKIDNAQAFLNMLSTNIDLAYDVETNGLKWQKCYICGYSISDGKDAYYVPVRHEPGGNIDYPEQFEEQIARIIPKRTKKLVGHNIKFDKHFSQNHSIDLGKNITDTMINAALLDEWKSSYSLENVGKQYPHVPQKKSIEIKKYIAEKFGCTTKDAMGNFYRLDGDDPMANEYAAVDTLSTYGIYSEQARDLYGQQLDVVVGMENQLISVLQKMERRGVKVNQEEAEKLHQEIDKLQIEAYQDIPLTEDLSVINTRSRKDLQQYFEYLNIQDWPTTPKGNPSFNTNYLKTKDEGECILYARKLDTFMNMFLMPLPEHIHNGRVHTNFNQTLGEYSKGIGGTKSGRLSCSGPNMQQIPKRDEFIGKRFRKIFEADEDFVLVELDYSQIEPRLFTHYSGEPILVEGYSQTPAIDMHQIASDYMGVERKVAKNLNLGMMYAMGTTKLAIQLGITTDEARLIVRKWYQTFRRVGSFTKQAAQVAEQRGYVKTILGRRARFNDLRFSYRAANRIVQGGAADILKWKLVELDRWIEANNLDDKVQMLLTIHDSVVLQIRKDCLHYIQDVKNILERIQVPPFNTKVPFTVAYEEPGINWSIASYGVH